MAISDTEDSGDLRRVVLYIFLFSWLFVLVDAILIATGVTDDAGLAILGQFGPSIVGVWYISKKYGKEGRGEYIARAKPRGNSPARLVVPIIIGLPLAVLAIGLSLRATGLLDDPPYDLYPVNLGLFRIGQDLWWLAFPFILFAGLIGGGISEEFGFRGYVLPMLQRRSNALMASVILTAIWTVWHLHPLTLAKLFTDGPIPFAQELIPYYLLFFVETLPLGILMTWAFNHSRGSIWIAILFHGTNNAIASIGEAIYGDEVPAVLEAGYHVLLWVIAVIVVAVYGPKNLHKTEPRWTKLFWEKDTPVSQ